MAKDHHKLHLVFFPDDRRPHANPVPGAYRHHVQVFLICLAQDSMIMLAAIEHDPELAVVLAPLRKVRVCFLHVLGPATHRRGVCDEPPLSRGLATAERRLEPERVGTQAFLDQRPRARTRRVCALAIRVIFCGPCRVV